MNFVTNWVTDKVAGYAATGIQAGGSLAGNAVGGVGTLLENSGRAVGQSTNGIAGAIGGVGGYINNYGQQVQNSMAADGPVSGGVPKKKAVKPNTAMRQSVVPTTGAPRPQSAATGASRQSPSTATRALSNASAPSVARFPSKPPPQTTRNLPSRKPIPAKPAANEYPSRSPISTSHGRAKPSTINRAKPVKAAAAISSRPQRFDNSKRPSISTSRSERNSEGKVKISPLSRPKPVKV